MRDIKEIQYFLKTYLDDALINDVQLPDNLLDPRTQEELSERFNLIYHKIIGPLCVTLTETLQMELSNTEIGFVSERLQAYLKEQGF